MKKRPAAFALLLCLLLCAFPVLTACGPESAGSEGSSGASGSASGGPSGDAVYQDAEGNYTLARLDRPAFEFTETEFRVCVYSNEVENTYFSEEIGYDLYDTTDDALNEGVRNRNNLVQQEYGVTVVPVPVANVETAVRENATAQTNTYDAAMPFMNACTVLAQDGLLTDLNSYGNYLHLEAPWWDQSANRMLSVAGKLYFTTGDISIMQKIVSGAYAFNKRLYQEYCADTYGDLYERVRNHTWTVDVMVEMARTVAGDIDGEPGMSYKDRWGLVGSTGVVQAQLLSSGVTLVGKDASDYPVLFFGTEENGVSYAQKLLQIFSEGSRDWFLNVQTDPTVTGDIWKTAVDVFGENRALFYSTAFSGIKKLRNYPNMDQFGMVPLPAASETQETYYTLSGGYAYGVCIPKGVPDPNFSAYMLDVLACGGKNFVTPAYYETALKIRDSSDAESAEMLDQYIFHDLVYDLGSLYDFGGVSSMLATMLKNNSTNVTSELERIRDSIILSIDDCVATYMLDN